MYYVLASAFSDQMNGKSVSDFHRKYDEIASEDSEEKEGTVENEMKKSDSFHSNELGPVKT